MWPGGSYPMDRQARAHFVHRDSDELTEIEDNFTQLNLDILDVAIDDLPKRYQRHTVGVLGRFSCFLCSV